ncbi:MAG: anion permease [Actinomycetota bacterium]|nr:inorganic phosphate transporter [Actinomycetota bacterium]
MALAFDYANGWHDAANSIATVVSTRVLSPRLAVIWAAFFNFIAFKIFPLKVAATIGKTLNLDKFHISDAVIFGALFGAIAWNVITWYFGLPTSSSHALIGGLVGSGFASTGSFVIVNMKSVIKTIQFIFIAPVMGLVLGLVAMMLIYWIFRRANPGFANKFFRRGQLLSAAAYSLGHGANDAQKTMGVIAVILITHHKIRDVQHIPAWVALAAFTAIALGTMTGGWRIVKTMGSKITKLVPMQGFAAEVGAATTLFATAAAGIPVSTTHTITGSIVGVGAIQRLSAVRWGVAGRVVWAWFITIPASALLAALGFYLAHLSS